MRKLVGVASFAVLAILSVSATFWLSGKYLASNNSKSTVLSSSTECQNKGAVHTVIIKDNKVTPELTNGHVCDTLTITNNDSSLRLIAFGEHDDHQSYDGVDEKILDKNQSFTITFDQTGTFTFHDHFEEKVSGTFTVSQ